MIVDLANIVDRLQKIEERLIREESVLQNIRCEVRDTMSLAHSLWDKQASEAINSGYTAPNNSESLRTRMSLSGNALLSGFKRKLSMTSTKSKIHPIQNIQRSASIDHSNTHVNISSQRPSSWTPDPFNNFMRSTKWDRFLRSDFFRKGVNLDSDTDTNSQSQMAINCIDDRFSATFVIHPESKFKKMWDVFESIVMVIQFFTLPVVLGFAEVRDGLPYLTIVTSIVYFLSMCISFRTGVQKNYVLLMDPSLIFDAYLKSGRFLFDIITALPYVFMIDAASPFSSDGLLNQELRFICILNGLRIFRLFTDQPPFWYRALLRRIRMKTKINAATVGIVHILTIMIVYWHWSACIHNLVAEVLDDKYSRNYSAQDRYTLFFYHSAAEMLAAGFGAHPPTTMVERWLTILNFLISAYLVATLVGNISSFMIGLDSSGRIFQEKMDEVSQYIAYKGLDWNLRNRILEYYQFKYSGGKYFDERRIMTELNSPLRQAIQINNCKSLIVKVPFFRDADNSFISQLVLCLEINHFLSGDSVIEADSTGEEMYFISSGICEVSINGDVKATLTSGSFFGEISLLFGKMKRTASIKCITPCVLYSLSKKQLDDVLINHPQMTAAIRAIAEERLRLAQLEQKQGYEEDETHSNVIDEEQKESAFSSENHSFL